MSDTIDHAALEAAARAATQGEWRYLSGSHGVRSLAGAEDKAVCTLNGPRRPDTQRDANAAYIVAAQPSVILALLEERKRLVADLQRATDVGMVFANRATAAEADRDRMKAALFPDPAPLGDGSYLDSAADLNLMGALYDLKRQDADAICIKTIERVLEQLQQARAALAGEKEPTNGA